MASRSVHLAAPARPAPGRLPARLALSHAVALGLVQGPTELLPVSSSAHTILIPFLLDWPYGELDPELRKSFEVALHAGAGLALAIYMRRELTDAMLDFNGQRAAVIALSTTPPALAGYALERFIESRLGGPAQTAAGLVVGAVAMALAEARLTRPGHAKRARGVRRARDVGRPRDVGRARGLGRPRGVGHPRGVGRVGRHESPSSRARRFEDARPGDGLALGLSQTAALLPGISRCGATSAVARARGFSRGDADALSWHAALPVILGASVLKGSRIARRGAPSDAGAALGAAAASAFASTLVSAHVIRPGRGDGRSLAGSAVYRCLLAALVLHRLRRPRSGGR